jgi:hypothetical protein
VELEQAEREDELGMVHQSGWGADSWLQGADLEAPARCELEVRAQRLAD